LSLSSPQYFLFLSCVIVLFYVLGKGRPRAILLLVASYYFYASLSGYYVFVLAVVTVCTFSAAWLIASAKGAARQQWLFAGVATLLAMPLFVFKYLEFVLGAGAAAISSVFWDPVSAPVLSLVQPVGISFFTFAAIGYVIDVYLDVIEPESRPIEFALFLSLFPIISAGPIERANRILPQLNLDADFNAGQALAGWRLILIGLVLKLVFADQLIGPANTVFNSPAKFIPLEQLFGAIFYVFYVYSDFAGYSLIAIGSGMLFGLTIRANFKQPFLSATIQDFWRRWHISLSSWARDYVFSPLQIHWRRRRLLGLSAAAVITFVLIGAWHGAAWGFVIFGLMHGVLTVGSLLTLRHRDAFWTTLKVPLVWIKMARVPITLALVILTFVVYRANSLSDAWVMYSNIMSFDLIHNIWYAIKILATLPGTPTAFAAIGFNSVGWLFITALYGGDILVRNNYPIQRFPVIVQVIFYNTALAAVIYSWVNSNTTQPFMYYQF
jgi:alginate O-acetyltransferase complex protein AlgI